MGSCFLFCVFLHQTELFRFSFILFVIFVNQCSVQIIKMNTYHTAPWSSTPSNSHYNIVLDLERGRGARMTSLETRLHSGEGTVGFEMVGDLFVNLAFEDLRKAG